MAIYQKGDLDIANVAYDIAKANYDRAEKALAVARHDLTQAERHRGETFRALVEKTASPIIATDREVQS